MKIVRVKAREVLDSRGNPTVEAEVETAGGVFRAIVPSGASTGSHEALELRDGGKRFFGKGVRKAVENVNRIISKKVVGLDCTDQEAVDSELVRLDGTPNKARLGANALLGVSMAVARAGAAAHGVELFSHLKEFSRRKPVLPVPFFNVINGGKHAGLENDFQEHMIAPVGAKSFSEAVQMGSEVYGVLRGIVEKKFGHGARLLADEGGFAPPVGLKQRMDLLEKAVSESGYSRKVRFAVDCAASEFFKKGVYTIGGKKYSSGELVDFYESFAREYGIVSIEDGLAEDDWANWRELVKAVSSRAQVVGDDFLVTNPERIRRAVSEKAATCLLLKPNQIGTVSEAVDAAGIAFEAGWGVMASHRSGESEDAFISDLAVGIGCGQCKFGAPARGERTAKYNQLLRIEEALGNKAGFSGRMFG